MLKYITSSKKILLMRICIVICLIIIWQLAALIINNRYYLPYFSNVFYAMGSVVKEAGFLLNLGMTIKRTFIAFIVALGIVIILCVAITNNPRLLEIIKPVNAIIVSLPPFVLIALLLIWTSRDGVPIILGILIAYPFLFETILGTLKNTKKKYQIIIKTFNVTWRNKLVKIYLPCVMYTIIAVSISTWLLTFKMVIAGEIFVYPKNGVGALINYERSILNMERIYAWILIIIIVTYSLMFLKKILQKRFLRWQDA